MFSNIEIKREIVKFDDNFEYKRKFNEFGKFDETIDQKIAVKVEEELEPETKKTKIETVLRDPRLVRRHTSCPTTIYTPNILQLNAKEVSNKWTTAPKVPKFDAVLQQIFQWSPQWLQGRVSDKPPLIRYEWQMKTNAYKLEYTQEEYVRRHLPHILRDLFIRLSDAFKDGAPARREHYIMINQCQNCGHLDINKLLECYALRDIRKTPKPFYRVNDIITISLRVEQEDKNDKKEIVAAVKKYFGLIVSHSLMELSELEVETSDQLIATFSGITVDQRYLVCDRLKIVTKRALHSNIVPKSFAQTSVLMNAGLEIRLMRNLLNSELKCAKLLSNILSGEANVVQFSNDDLKEVDIVRDILIKHTEEMIVKSGPMVFFKDIKNLLAINISDQTIRLELLCDSMVNIIRRLGKPRFLVVTKDKISANRWRKRIESIRGKTRVNVWNLNPDLHWAVHNEVKNFVIQSARKGFESCDTKLKNTKPTDDCYQQLIERKCVYKQILDKRTINSIQLPAVHIARQEFSDRGLESILKDKDVIIGTLADVVDCRHLISSKPFDCCIVDDCHLLSDVHVVSVLHLGTNCMIIGGDTDHRLASDHSIDDRFEYNTSLFHRVFQKNINCSPFV